MLNQSQFKFLFKVFFCILLLSSLTVNIFLVNQYGLIVKLKYRIEYLIGEHSEKTRSDYTITEYDTNISYFYKNSLEEVYPLESAEPLVEASELPARLVIKPCFYKYRGNTYDFSKEGLYRGAVIGVNRFQRIVYDGSLDVLLSSLAWVVTHGRADTDMIEEEITVKALTSKVVLNCSSISNWAKHILDKYGYESRLVVGMTLEEWNYYDNGHTMLEVYRRDLGSWVVYDLDNNLRFLNPNDRSSLSFMEFMQVVSEGNYVIDRIAYDAGSDVFDSYSFTYERILFDLKTWYAKNFQVPLVYADNYHRYVFHNKEHREQIEAFTDMFRFVDQEEFLDIAAGGNH